MTSLTIQTNLPVENIAVCSPICRNLIKIDLDFNQFTELTYEAIVEQTMQHEYERNMDIDYEFYKSEEYSDF
jgi:hypothetical protein